VKILNGGRGRRNTNTTEEIAQSKDAENAEKKKNGKED
jgi:hypothetical protein